MRTLPPAAIGAALALAACSTDPALASDAIGAPSPTPAASPVAATAPTRAAPQAGETRTFGDWAVACDNVRICTMASLGGDGADVPAATMALTRQPGGDGGWDLAFGSPGDDPVRPLAAVIDGRRFALDRLDGAPAAALVGAIAGGRALTLVPGDQRLSLRGAAAALRWIDAQQGRAGTVTAAVAKGDRPAATVPARGSPPTVEALTPGGTARSPTAAQLAAMRRQAGCDGAIIRRVGIEPAVHALGGGATLVLLPCSTGAYNLSQALFVLRDGRVAPAKVDAPTGFGLTPAAGTDRVASVVNGEWTEGELRDFAKGRGLGDCGVRQTLVWDGTRLRLAAQSVMGECRGNPDFLTTWRTQVVRR